MDERVIKHLELVQGVISRMAGNSFLLKGWSVTLTAAVVGLAAKDMNPHFVLIAFFPAVAFWGLDAYYLRNERLYRALYDALRAAPDVQRDAVEPFSMDTSRFETCVEGVLGTMLSKSVVWVHGIVVFAIVVVFLVL